MEEVRKMLSETTEFNGFGDLDEKNFGENQDGKIVYFDV
jgi:hypothetical protein